MSHGALTSMRALAAVSALVWAAQLPVVGQTPAAAAKATAKTGTAAKAPFRTAWGDPDLQGVWNTATITELERPAQFAGKEFLTPDEARQHEMAVARGEVTPVGHVSHNLDAPPKGGSIGLYNDFWMEQGSRVVASRRTSLIVDPKDGKIPPLTPEVQKKLAALAEARSKRRPNETLEDVPTTSRCVLWTGGPPIIPTFYNNNYQIVQTPDHVAIRIEMPTDYRIIPLDGRPHLSPAVGQWHGSSRGRWEGSTLVVDTTNFRTNAATFGVPNGRNFSWPSENMHVIERFTRVDKDTIKYEFTIEDPTVFTRPWSAEVPMVTATDKIYEYACHEGNYYISNVFGAARAMERAAEEAAKKK